MARTIAFELRADSQDFSGGTLFVPHLNPDAYDVKAALDDGGGKIVLHPDPEPPKPPADDASQATREKYAEKVEDEQRRAAGEARLVEALDNFPALKRAAADTAESGSASNSKAKGSS